MTDKLKKAAQQALGALENPWASGPEGVANAITALRVALAEQKDAEPVAWMTHSKEPLPLFHKTKAGAEAWGAEPQPLYAHPPRLKWQSLTDEEIRTMWAMPEDLSWMDSVVRLVRAVEAALKEKNT